MPVELQPVGEVLSPPASPDELHDGDDRQVATALLTLLQNQHEEEAKDLIRWY